MKCNKCGNEIAENEKFCSACGTPAESERQWYCTDGENEIGPISENQLIQYIQNRTVFADTLIWSEGLKNWISVSESIFSGYIPDVQVLNPTQNRNTNNIIIGFALAFLLAFGGMGFFVYHNNQVRERERIAAETEQAKKEAEEAKAEAEKAQQEKEEAEEAKAEAEKKAASAKNNRTTTTKRTTSSSNGNYIGTYYSHVDSGYLALRSTPNRPADDSNVIGEMWTNGTEVKVISKGGTYWYVYVPSLGMKGYTDSRYLYN